ncbi:hypothetical protein CR513_38708, partial [Mucuna pruriens]
MIASKKTYPCSSWKGKEREKEGAIKDKSPKKGSEPPPSSIKNLEKGHIASQCPNRRTMALEENDEVESRSSQEETSSSSERESYNDSSQYESDLLMVRRLMSTLVEEETKSQRENIFHSRCFVLRKLFSFIIDGGSNVNVATIRLVEKLALPTLPHPKPYNG